WCGSAPCRWDDVGIARSCPGSSMSIDQSPRCVTWRRGPLLAGRVDPTAPASPLASGHGRGTIGWWIVGRCGRRGGARVMKLKLLAWCLVMLLGLRSSLAAVADDAPATAGELFGRPNLVAWCIVPFDAKKRGPEERAAMLERLGFRRFAYDWRAEHLPTF